MVLDTVQWQCLGVGMIAALRLNKAAIIFDIAVTVSENVNSSNHIITAKIYFSAKNYSLCHLVTFCYVRIFC